MKPSYRKEPFKFVPIPIHDGRTAYFTAGSAITVPNGRALVRLARDVAPAAPVAFDLSVDDFQPFDLNKVIDACPKILGAALSGARLHVGCRAGIGRTGTMLACLAAYSGYFSGSEAVAYVRQVYLSGAVETAEQEALIDDVARYVQTSGRATAEKAEPSTRKSVKDLPLKDATLLDWIVSKIT